MVETAEWARLSLHSPSSDDYAARFVDDLLNAAQAVQASDIHLQPAPDGLQVSWRLDGVLQFVGTFPRGTVTDVVTRVKVLAHLLTYRTDVPQEGRIQDNYRRARLLSQAPPPADVEMRVSTFPTLYGERAVIRLFAESNRFIVLSDLGLMDDVFGQLREALQSTSGAVIISGPAGSGKTTTAYACLREIVQATKGGRSLVTLEDPIEVAVEGTSQSQVNLAADFTLLTGLKSLLRQDPEVMMIGEIRDAATAQLCLQASLTGQLVLTTFHAGSAAESVSRLLDMQLEPYLLRSGVRAILSQRLLRRLCHCAVPCDTPELFVGMNMAHARKPVGCDDCHHTGYRGRLLTAEFLEIRRGRIAESVLKRESTRVIEQAAMEHGMTRLHDQAIQAVENGRTSAQEIIRVFGHEIVSPSRVDEMPTLTK